MGTPYPTPITPSKTNIGWIGIGVMGAAMASRLLSAGYSVTIYARNPSNALPLQSQGAQLANSPFELAQCSDIVFTMVGHPSDVRQNVLDKNGILSGLNWNGVTVDMTSSHPELASEIFAAARAKDCWAVDAPVSGGDIGARNGKLAIFAGGDDGVVKWLSPLFDILGKVTYVGQAGCGQSSKIANQIVVGANLIGLSEGLVFAERAGLDVRKYMEGVRGGAAGSMVMDLFGERMIGRDFKAGAFAEYMVKDLGMSVDMVENGTDEKLVVLPGAALCKQLFTGMVANGDGKLGTQGLITVIERINGAFLMGNEVIQYLLQGLSPTNPFPYKKWRQNEPIPSLIRNGVKMNPSLQLLHFFFFFMGAPICYCGILSKLKTAWIDLDPGRRFYACSKTQNNGVMWSDPIMCERVKKYYPWVLRGMT